MTATPPAMSDEQAQSVQELASFLKHPRPELRKSASSYLLNMTASDQSLFQLMHLPSFDVIQALCRLVSDLRPIAEDAIKALINLTASNPVACERALKYDLLNRVMNQLEDEEWRLKDYSMMLVANVTTTPEGTRALLGYEENASNASLAYRELKVRKLAMLFMETEPEPEGVDKHTGEPKWDDEYQYVANILANITQIEEGRRFMLVRANGIPMLVAVLRKPRASNIHRTRALDVLTALASSAVYLDELLVADVVGRLERLLQRSITENQWRHLHTILLHLARQCDPQWRALAQRVESSLNQSDDRSALLAIVGILTQKAHALNPRLRPSRQRLALDEEEDSDDP